MTVGRVYKLTAEGCDKCYVGSTKSKYVSIRMAHHRESHNKDRYDYQGLFANGDPDIEILKEIEYEDGEDWILRKEEQDFMSMNIDNCINKRRCYISPEEKIKMRDENIKKYHNTEKGKLALRKGAINHRLKQTKKSVTGLKRKQLLNELKEITERQSVLASSSGKSESPPPPHQDQSVLVLLNTE
jgi:hypothetical protein